MGFISGCRTGSAFPETEMHIGKFSYFRCEETIRECKKLMEQNKIKIETVSYEENKFAA